jgi:hypothetical protein
MLIMADPTIILVHGAFADGLTIEAPPNPLRGVTVEDAEYMKCGIEQVEGPVLLIASNTTGWA